MEWHNERVVAKGFKQIDDEDFSGTLSEVARPTIAYVVLTLAIAKGWKIWQLDVHKAFLNGQLIEIVFCETTPDYVDSSRPNHVYKLQQVTQ